MYFMLDGPLKNLCDRHKEHPESIAVVVEIRNRERDPDARPNQYIKLSDNLQSILDDMRYEDMTPDDRRKAIRDKHASEQQKEYKRLCRLAAAKFLRKVSNDIGARTEWTMEDFKENLSKYASDAFDVSQEAEIPLSDLHDAIDEVVADAFGEPLVYSLHLDEELYPKFLPPELSGRMKVTQNLIEKAVAGKSEEDMSKMYEDVRSYFNTELRNLMKRE